MIVEQVEKSKQDDCLSEISNILGDLKDMAIDMGTEIERSVLSIFWLEFIIYSLSQCITGSSHTYCVINEYSKVILC